MRKRILLIGTLIILAAVLLVGGASLAKGPEKIWVAEFIYDVPDGTWEEGVHSYQYEATWTEPSPGGWPPFGPYEVTIDEGAPLYPGSALIRFGYGIVRMPPPRTRCERLEPEILHPDQAMRFHLGWPADWEMTYPEARAHFGSMTITVAWDGGDPVELEQQEIFAFPGGKAWDHKWANSLCNWTVRP